jgi:acetyltransferase-like isoleucine patch superfamily enzyme
MRSLIYFYKGIKLIYYQIDQRFSWIFTWLKFTFNGIKFNDFVSKGRPIVRVSISGKCYIGKNLELNNGKYYNMIGRQQQCYLIVGPHATLIIGNNVGISCSSIVCNKSITIGDNVKIGGNTVIYDSDFHSLNKEKRNCIPEDLSDIVTKAVTIGNDAFIGAHTTILKGVTIGENAIIGAGSVISKDIPKNQIWAGNPAKFIRNI